MIHKISREEFIFVMLWIKWICVTALVSVWFVVTHNLNEMKEKCFVLLFFCFFVFFFLSFCHHSEHENLFGHCL